MLDRVARVRRKEERRAIWGRVVEVEVVGDVGDVGVICGCWVSVAEERVVEDERRGDLGGSVVVGIGLEEDIGAISFAIRTSMKVMNVKATLWTGADDRISRIQD